MEWAVKQEKKNFFAKWNFHKWFAWYPIRCEEFKKIWLKTVERRRRGSFNLGYWEYRKIKN